MSLFPKYQEQKIPFILTSTLVISLIVLSITASIAIGMLSQYTSYNYPDDNLMTIEGSSTVTVIPDLAKLSFTIENTEPAARVAQEKTTNTGNELLAKIKELGVAEEKIQTSHYGLSEYTSWDEETRDWIAKGWTSRQMLNVEITNFDLIPDLLLLASEYSAEVYGPNFSVHDEEMYREEARQLAIEDAKKQAASIEQNLGIKLDEIVDYYEYLGGSDNYYPLMKTVAYDAVEESVAISPEIEAGDEELTMNVSITYRVK